MADELRIFDLPLSQGQVHIHGDGTTLTGGRLYDYSRQHFVPLNGYECAMADLHAERLELPRMILPDPPKNL